MSNEKQCIDCESFKQLRTNDYGSCMPVAKFLHLEPVVNPMVVCKTFGCVLWEEKPTLKEG